MTCSTSRHSFPADNYRRLALRLSKAPVPIVGGSTLDAQPETTAAQTSPDARDLVRQHSQPGQPACPPHFVSLWFIFSRFDPPNIFYRLAGRSARAHRGWSELEVIALPLPEQPSTSRGNPVAFRLRLTPRLHSRAMKSRARTGGQRQRLRVRGAGWLAGLLRSQERQGVALAPLAAGRRSRSAVAPGRATCYKRAWP